MILKWHSWAAWFMDVDQYQDYKIGVDQSISGSYLHPSKIFMVRLLAYGYRQRFCITSKG